MPGVPQAQSIQPIIGHGWFDAHCIRALLDAEPPGRMLDIEGPESDALVVHSGWHFIEDPLHVALVNENGRTLAAAWIVATTRGLNLTYARSHAFASQGLATLAAACALVAYSREKNPMLRASGLNVHAQYEQANHASARVALRLGLQPAQDLSFTAHLPQGARYFIGSESPWPAALEKAQTIAATRGLLEQ